MALRIYNTLSGRLDEIVPGGVKKDSIDEYPPVTMYSCGPTIYNYAHIGNFRTYVMNDILRRYLKFRGFQVNHAMNLTDVDDKTIAGARAEGIPLREYTDRFARIFFEDCATLNIEPVEHVPRATESIKAMAEIIDRLHDRGYVYEKEGSLYFSIARFDTYGRLSRLDSREIRSGARYDADEYEKDDVRDFALWKSAREGEDSWPLTFGAGRPGWHIECSAMVRQIFGGTIDIHTGGVDLIFPHHENEIAQSEAAYDEPFVRHWIHWEHLLVEGTKMSKSKGNYYTLRDLIERGHEPRAIRYLLLSAHYRKQLNFTMDGLKQAEAALERIDNFLLRLRDVKPGAPDNPAVGGITKKFFTELTEAVDDDLNISAGLGVFFEFIHVINGLIAQEMVSAPDRDAVMAALEHLDRVFGFIFMTSGADDTDAARVESLIAERATAKKEKNFARADAIRRELLDENVVLEDTKDGTRWKRR